ncbi:MAG: hypothetical protein AAGG02_09525 [Cyanobacteria bacterium P01_H01_bin.15]
MEQGRTADDDTLQELKELRQQNQALQGELQQFHQLKQLLGGGSGNNEGASDSGNTVAQASSTQPRKRVRITAEALQDVDQAISLIMQWNDEGVSEASPTGTRPFNDKWYISFPALQELLRSSGRSASQPRVKAALDNRREEINHHHDTHGLGQKHNARHQHSITEVMALET